MKGRLRNNLAASHRCLKNYKDEELEQIPLQQEEIFCLGIVIIFSTMKTEEHWNSLPWNGICIFRDTEKLKKTRQSLQQIDLN